jgi:hypothetical protein
MFFKIMEEKAMTPRCRSVLYQKEIGGCTSIHELDDNEHFSF